MHTEGKRLNLDKTDQWEMVLWTVICQLSNENFTECLSQRLGIGDEGNEIQKTGRS